MSGRHDLEGPIAPGTVHRVMGIETEFGVTAEAHGGDRADVVRHLSAMALSHVAVAGYAFLAEHEHERVGWDYGDETPLRDARGFELDRASAHPSQLTHLVADARRRDGASGHAGGGPVPSVELDVPLRAPERAPEDLDADATIRWALDHSIGNAVLRNGARLYVDHAHPEYSAPEVTDPRDAVVWDKAGEVVAARSLAALAGASSLPALALYKNNTDGKGASYGTHENYLVDRSVPFATIIEGLTPFLVARQVLVGAGRVGVGQRSETAGYQVSSRADFFEREVGLETTINRPIINTRDEPHSDAARYRRLHVIMGDANLYETATYLKLGTTALVLSLIESGAEMPVGPLADPVEALHAVSHDPDLAATIPLADGGEITALEILDAYAAACADHAEEEARRLGHRVDERTADVLARWKDLVARLGSDRDGCAGEVEWVGKLALLEAYRRRGGLAWDDPRLRVIDLQFTDLRPGKSLYRKLAGAGRAARIVEDAEIERAVHEPPATTRAFLRGSLISAHRERVLSAGWDCITLEGRDGAQRLRLADPTAGSRPWCERQGIDPSRSVDELLATLRKDM